VLKQQNSLSFPSTTSNLRNKQKKKFYERKVKKYTQQDMEKELLILLCLALERHN